MIKKSREEQPAAVLIIVIAAFSSLPLWAPAWLLPVQPISTRIAGVGGLLALCGIFVIARPVWRLGGLWGPFNYVSARMFMDFPELADEPDIKKLNDVEQKALDDIAAQVMGPMLVGMGTVVNAFSGYFATAGI